jgi:hypothetical protein
MMIDLVTRARMWPAADYASPLLNELADEIEALTAKIEELEETIWELRINGGRDD